jgi:hypothetical protein
MTELTTLGMHLAAVCNDVEQAFHARCSNYHQTDRRPDEFVNANSSAIRLGLVIRPPAP